MTCTTTFYKALIENATKESIKRFVVGGIIKRTIIGKGPLEGKSIEQILILKRHINDFLPGIYELPSGRVEEGETLKGALFREIAEETGLVAKEILNYVNHFDYSSKSGNITRQFNFVVKVDNPSNVRLSEHDGYAWVDPSDFQNYNITENVKRILKEQFESTKNTDDKKPLDSNLKKRKRESKI